MGRLNFCPAKGFRLGLWLTSKKDWPSLSENIDKYFFFQFKLFDNVGGERAGGKNSGSTIKKLIFCHEFKLHFSLTENQINFIQNKCKVLRLKQFV